MVNVATISLDTGHVVDTEIISRYCQTCAKHTQLKIDPIQYENFLESHSSTCMANHSGSAGAMEVVGSLSGQLQKTVSGMLSFLAMEIQKVSWLWRMYQIDIKVSKLKCIGHVQKRVGNRLRKLNKSTKELGGKAD